MKLAERIRKIRADIKADEDIPPRVKVYYMQQLDTLYSDLVTYAMSMGFRVIDKGIQQ